MEKYWIDKWLRDISLIGSSNYNWEKCFKMTKMGYMVFRVKSEEKD